MKVCAMSLAGRFWLGLAAAMILLSSSTGIAQTEPKETNLTLYAGIQEARTGCPEIKLKLMNRRDVPETLPAPQGPTACHYACTVRTPEGQLIQDIPFAPPPKALMKTGATWIELGVREAYVKTVPQKDFGIKPLPMGRYTLTFHFRPSLEKNDANLVYSSSAVVVQVRYDNDFMKANPNYFLRAGTFYKSEYLTTAAAQLKQAADLTDEQALITQKALAGFIDRRLDYYCRYNGTMDWSGLEEATRPLDETLQAALSDAQFKRYLQWREDGNTNALGFLFHPNFRNTAVAPADLILANTSNIRRSDKNGNTPPEKPKPPLEWQITIVRPELHPFESVPIHLRILQNTKVKAPLAVKPEGELQVRLTPQGKPTITKTLKLSEKPVLGALQYLTGFTSPVFYGVDLDLRVLFDDLPPGKYRVEFTFPPQTFLGEKDISFPFPSKPMASPPLFFQVHDITRKSMFEAAETAGQQTKNPDGLLFELMPLDPNPSKAMHRIATVRNNRNYPISFQIFGKPEDAPDAKKSPPRRALSQHEVFTGRKKWEAQPTGYDMKDVYRQTLQPGQSLNIFLFSPRYKGLYRYYLPVEQHLPDAPAKPVRLYSQSILQTVFGN